MPPIRTKTPQKSAEQEGRILKALEAIEKQEISSLREAARQYDVPQSTLRRRQKGIKDRATVRANSSKLTKLEEELLKRRTLSMKSRGKAPSRAKIREFANILLLERDSLSPIPRVGKNWVTNYLKRHPDLASYLSKRDKKSHPDIGIYLNDNGSAPIESEQVPQSKIPDLSEDSDEEPDSPPTTLAELQQHATSMEAFIRKTHGNGNPPYHVIAAINQLFKDTQLAIHIVEIFKKRLDYVRNRARSIGRIPSPEDSSVLEGSALISQPLEAIEPPSQPRTRAPRKCGRCGNTGHNRTTCKNMPRI